MRQQPAILVTILLILAAAPAGAQRLTGRVIDESTEAGVALARLTLVAADSSVARRASTDEAGYFLIDAPAGVFRIRVEALGYAQLMSDSIRLVADEVVNVVLRLSVDAVPLAPLEVRARGGEERGRYGFERRRALGKGWFLTEDSIRLRDPRVATDALRGIPNVALIDGPDEPLVYSWSGSKCLAIFIDNMPKPIEWGYAPTVSDLRSGRVSGDRYGLNLYVGVHRIRAIEVYRDWYEVPLELRTAMRVGYLMRSPARMFSGRVGSLREIEPCGVVWVWTDNGW